MRLRLLGAVGALALLTALACGDNEDSDSRSVNDLTSDDLAVLVLPQAALGALAEDMEIDPDSGYDDNAESAEDSLDPDDTEESLTEAGRITSYGLGFIADDPFEALAAGEGLMRSGSSVELYESADQASAALDKRVADFEAADGETVESLEIGGVERIPVEDNGDEAGGLRFEAHLPGADITIYQSIVFMRKGPLVGAIQVQAADDTDRVAAMEEALDELEDRIEDFLDGELDDETPIAIPTAETEPTTPATEEPGESTPDGSGTPAETPDGSTAGELDAARAALTYDDMPIGLLDVSEEYEDGTSDFTRTFESVLDLTEPIGDSAVLEVENNIILFGSSIEASAFIGVVGDLLIGDDGGSFFDDALGDSGVEGESQLTLREIEVGDGGVIVEGSVDVGFAVVDLAFLMARQGSGVSALIVTGLPGELFADDLLPYLQITIDRLAALLQE